MYLSNNLTKATVVHFFLRKQRASKEDLVRSEHFGAYYVRG
jgi:hypothetical protein